MNYSPKVLIRDVKQTMENLRHAAEHGDHAAKIIVAGIDKGSLLNLRSYLCAISGFDTYPYSPAKYGKHHDSGAQMEHQPESACGAAKDEWLTAWGYTPGTTEAEEAWQHKIELDERVYSRGTLIQGNFGVIPDIQPYKSMITGEMIHSRSKHRTHLRDHECVEIGNETKYVDHRPPPERVDWKPEIIKNMHLAKEGKLQAPKAA